MGIRELRDLAKLEGVATNGTKKELVERLSNCINKNDEKVSKKDSDEEKDKKGLFDLSICFSTFLFFGKVRSKMLPICTSFDEKKDLWKF